VQPQDDVIIKKRMPYSWSAPKTTPEKKVLVYSTESGEKIKHPNIETNSKVERWLNVKAKIFYQYWYRGVTPCPHLSEAEVCRSRSTGVRQELASLQQEQDKEWIFSTGTGAGAIFNHSVFEIYIDYLHSTQFVTGVKQE